MLTFNPRLMPESKKVIVKEKYVQKALLPKKTDKGIEYFEDTQIMHKSHTMTEADVGKKFKFDDESHMLNMYPDIFEKGE